MTVSQEQHLVKMANQIALNMAAWGDQREVARMTTEHMTKFWTPAMRRQLLDYRRNGGEGLSPVVEMVLAAMENTLSEGGQTT